MNAAFARFKNLADKKHEIFDDDLQALVSDTLQEGADECIKLMSIKASIETGEKPKSEITLSIDGEEKRAYAEGGGPVDNITTGTDSQGEVTVRIGKDGRIVNGLGADTDIVTASAKAYINALNKVFAKSERAHPQV